MPLPLQLIMQPMEVEIRTLMEELQGIQRLILDRLQQRGLL